MNWAKGFSWQDKFSKEFLEKFRQKFQTKFQTIQKKFQKNFKTLRGDLWLQAIASFFIFLFFFQNCAPSKFEPGVVSKGFISPNSEPQGSGLTPTPTPTSSSPPPSSSSNLDSGGTSGTGTGTGTDTGTGNNPGGVANGGGTDTGGGVEVPKTEPPKESRINDTGQTKCDNGSELVDCSQVTDLDLQRQDGHLGRDVLAKQNKLSKKGDGWAGFDYTKICMDGKEGCTNPDTGATPPQNTWACTRDNVTGLVWSLESKNEAAGTFVGQNSIPYNNRCNLATGWRMPKVFELLGIMNSNSSSNPFDKNYFPDTQSSMYPSGQPTTAADQLWTVNFQDGTTNEYGAKNAALNLRLVNGPDNSNLDSLKWDKCPYPALGDDCKNGAPGSYTWYEALKAVRTANTNNHLGSSNWRLPNKIELASLWKPERLPYFHYIDPNLYPDSREAFWTSTNVREGSAWSINFYSGEIINKLKTQRLHIRLVRDP